MIRKSRNGDFHLIDGGTHIDAWAEAAGRLDHDQNSLPRVLPYVPAGGTVVDAGAYTGDWTTAFLLKVGPLGQVFAFEPNPEAFECLQLNCPWASCHKVALCNQLGTGGLLPPTDNNYGATQVFPNAPFGDVQLMALDSLALTRLDLLKADVEGCEYDLLLGAARTIERFRPVLVVEVNESALKSHDGCTPQHLIELIISFNYNVKNLYPRQDVGGPMCDVICLPL